MEFLQGAKMEIVENWALGTEIRIIVRRVLKGVDVAGF